MNWFKDVFGRIWAVWAIVLFCITMLFFLIPVALFCLTTEEPKRTHRFIRYARIWMAIFLPGIGCPLFVRGKEHFKKGQPYIVICNHNALMDVPISSPAIPGGNKTIAKAEMAKVPVFGMIYKLGSVLVDRKSDRSRKESYTKMKEVLAMGLHMCIYPEGTRNTTDQPLKPFHDGAFRLAIDTKTPIIPGVISYTRIVNPPDKGFYLMPHPLLIEFLEPIEVTENDTTDSLKERAFEVMGKKVRWEMGDVKSER